MTRAALPAPAAVLLLGPAVAHAHLTDTGLGPIYDGIAHLFVSIDDLLPVVAMAMLAGLNGPGAARRALFTLPVAWLASGMAATASAGALPPSGLTSVSLLVLGILTAASVRLASPIVTALALGLGLMHGWLNGAAFAAAARQSTALVGIAGAIFVVAALVSALVVSLQVPWTRIGVRVVGSWIAATGLLLLGWTVSGRL